MARGPAHATPHRKFCITAHGTSATAGAPAPGARAVWATFQSLQAGHENVRHAYGQLERGADSGLLHVQGYLEFDRPVRFSHLKRILGDPSLHVEVANGSAEQNHEYCGKEETREEGPFSIGEPGGKQGARTDVQRIQALLQEGADNRKLWVEEFTGMARIYKAVDRYRAEMYSPPGYQKLTVSVYWGDTGLGKTRKAVWEADERGKGHCRVDVPDKLGAAKWFDGYTDQGTIIIDDYNGEYSINFLKRLLDGYHIILPVKGNFIARKCTHIVITSNHDPAYWYPEATAEDYDAIKRRFTTVTHFLSPWLPPISE